MNKDTVIRIFGGNMQLVAEAMGCTRQAVHLWATDMHGDLLSPTVCDAVLATLVRLNYAHREANPNGLRYEFDDRILADLLAKPERIKRRPKRPFKGKARSNAAPAMA